MRKLRVSIMPLFLMALNGRRMTHTACYAADQSCEIYTMNADGSNQTNLTNSPASGDYDPDWAKVVLK